VTVSKLKLKRKSASGPVCGAKPGPVCGPARLIHLVKASGLAASLAFSIACGAQAAKPILTPAPQPAAPAPAQTAPAQPLSVIEADKYIIGPDDQLQISVWKEPNLSGSFPVRPDGMISMVLIGDVRAAGFTPMQLGANLSQQLKKYVQDPLVTVLVTQVNSQRIFLVGEVGHVGALPITPGMTPLQAIAAAGGLTPYARSKKIYILRGPQGNQQKIPYDYKAALKGTSQQNVTLQPGDTVVVP
jgi:polysaccharide export outer membrane protein